MDSATLAPQYLRFGRKTSLLQQQQPNMDILFFYITSNPATTAPVNHDLAAIGSMRLQIEPYELLKIVNVRAKSSQQRKTIVCLSRFPGRYRVRTDRFSMGSGVCAAISVYRYAEAVPFIRFPRSYQLVSFHILQLQQQNPASTVGWASPARIPTPRVWVHERISHVTRSTELRNVS
ncbi:hypothetical protein CBL_12459 [Carabus blaptoides fortunei]